MILKAKGHDVETFSKPIEAINALSDNPPDLIVTDVTMPGINGIDFRDILCKIFKDDLNLVTISGNDKEKIEKIYNTEITGPFFRKPLNDNFFEYIQNFKNQGSTNEKDRYASIKRKVGHLNVLNSVMKSYDDYVFKYAFKDLWLRPGANRKSSKEWHLIEAKLSTCLDMLGLNKEIFFEERYKNGDGWRALVKRSIDEYIPSPTKIVVRVEPIRIKKLDDPMFREECGMLLNQNISEIDDVVYKLEDYPYILLSGRDNDLNYFSEKKLEFRPEYPDFQNREGKIVQANCIFKSLKNLEQERFRVFYDHLFYFSLQNGDIKKSVIFKDGIFIDSKKAESVDLSMNGMTFHFSDGTQSNDGVSLSFLLEYVPFNGRYTLKQPYGSVDIEIIDFNVSLFSYGRLIEIPERYTQTESKIDRAARALQFCWLYVPHRNIKEANRDLDNQEIEAQESFFKKIFKKWIA